MSGTIIRKMVVLGRIEKLPEDEQERAFRLYAILDRIEWLTIAPIIIGIYSGFLLSMITAETLFASILRMQLPSGGLIDFLYGLMTLILCSASCIFGLKVLYFNPRREQSVNELRKTLLSDSQFNGTLKTLKELDPDMARNIRKHIP